MNANPQHRTRGREISLILSDSGAELIDNNAGQLWASDSDNEFREEFPDLITEEDSTDILDYLVERGLLSDDEADDADILMADDGPGDEDENGDEDDDENGDEDENEDDD